jgi:hypothetical protein
MISLRIATVLRHVDATAIASASDEGMLADIADRILFRRNVISLGMTKVSVMDILRLIRDKLSVEMALESVA